ncbi:protein kinase domain-containing protein [Sorangium sp. So ce1000]|uniref:protein kinase domain-containing protein n=1 Tax=Sorangium sp. So ce1000 TaxID=3133325 RepID=UPI003F614A5D
MAPRDDTLLPTTQRDDNPQAVGAARERLPGAGGTRASAEASAPSQAAPRGEESQLGRVIAGRYRLVERLGVGAHGEVWAADDLVLGGQVAFKWMRHAAGQLLSRIRREVTTLRMLRVPGVVQLLDDGTEGGRPFLVMERVEGEPFPGNIARRGGERRCCSWAALADPTMALLEVLARVHAAGIVHRDLKPDNILVSPEGRPTVLDFGVSLWRDPADRLTEAGEILGTPLYLAPEQILGKAVDPRTDLYAIGVMLYDALTGQIPHDREDLQTMLRARLLEPAPPVHELAADLPADVAGIVDRLLARDKEQRFRTATEVLAALRGQPAIARAGPTLPLLGDGRALGEVLAAARAGRSVDVVGTPGSGRSRCLGDAAEALAHEGRGVAWTRAARAPLASVQAVVGVPQQGTALGLADMTAWVEAELRSVLARGVVVLADDAEGLDRWSAAVLDRVRSGRGTIVRALLAAPSGAREEAADVVWLGPLDETALRPLFAGPDRLLHLREDAARALWERTEGLPLWIEAEVTLWVRLGLARWDSGQLRIDRDGLVRLNAGMLGAMRARSSPVEREREPHQEELLRWLAVGGHHLELPQLAQVMEQPLWKIEAECEALEASGAARRLPGGRMALRGQVDIPWPSSRRLAAHRAIARTLRPGQEGRLMHWLAAEEVREAWAEALEVAQLRGREGDLGAALTALEEVLRVVRLQDDVEAGYEDALLAEWVKLAFAEGTPYALDRVLYELSRAVRRTPKVQHLEALVRAGLAAPGANGMLALELADGIPPFADAELERRRQRVRVVVAAAKSSPALLAEVLAAVREWAERSGEPMAQLCFIEGQALLRYSQGRFDEAAALHAVAAEQEPRLTARIAATVNCASALLEAFRHQEAAERAAIGRELAARARHAYWEGRAEWLLRAARYRMGEAHEPDLELVEAVQRVGVQELEALVRLNEAAVAYRAGALELAAVLADRAAWLWRQMARPWGALLARSVALASGAGAQEAEVRALAELAVQCRVPGIGIQALGLLGPVFPEARPSWREAVRGLVHGIPREHWGRRIEVLSVEEALEGALGGGGSSELMSLTAAADGSPPAPS